MFSKRIQNQIKNMSKKIYNDTLRDIIVYGPPVEYDCPNCHYNPSTSTSTGKYDTSFVTPVVVNGTTINPKSFTRGRCPVCRGKGKIEFDNKKLVRGYVRWDPPSDSKGEFDALPIGTEGHNIVMFRTDPCYYEFIRDSIYSEIDGVRCELYRPPSVRKIGREDLFVLAFFSSSEEGSSTRT